ncbi:MAG: thiamine phosphate synthase [Candidatus Symbiothrix sp.]|jgi:thiamine-phosphate pyrophosphorylase|nr:thiamine phosphate synthase [Candidatus Symbiothrix sp.]
MKMIVITTENSFEGEALVLNQLFERGMKILHLRKPFASEEELYTLLSQVNERFHNRIVLHDQFSLLRSFHLKGVHLNRRNPIRPQQEPASVSSSCHSLEELENSNDFNYVFLSPVFDSISKSGYTHAFTREELQSAKAKGLINNKVIALGGISPETIPLVADYGFGGIAVLGALWGDFPQDKDKEALLKRFDNFNSFLYE